MNKDNISLINEMMNISIALSSEKKLDVILDMILHEARKITNADAGTIYMLHNNELRFHATQNDTLGIRKTARIISWPSVKMSNENVSAYVCMTGETLNIQDVYNNNKFDFSGPKQYDAISGYKTKSMLVIPLTNHELEVIGVLQLINSKKNNGEIIGFSEDTQKIIMSLSSQAAVSITNAKLFQETKNIFKSFVRVMVTALDSQTPYNANHTKNMALMTDMFIDYLNKEHFEAHSKYSFSIDKKAEIMMSVWLHDIGKISIPLEVLNKPYRLGNKKDLEIITNRIDLIKSKLRIRHLEARLQNNDKNNDESSSLWLKKNYAKLKHAKEIILLANKQDMIINDAMKKNLKNIYETKFKGIDEKIITKQELAKLCIEKGTLLPNERKIIENHTLVTNKMLSEIKFKKPLKNIPDIISKHHELLDGTGYPNGITGKDIPVEARILTIIDIFESLTSIDRPYRKAFSVEKGLNIINDMAIAKKLDLTLVNYFINSQIPYKFYERNTSSDNIFTEIIK